MSGWRFAERRSSSGGATAGRSPAVFVSTMPGMKRGENIYLVGLMGAGKTTVGRLLARRLKLRFVDSDQEIERRCGVKIPLIWEIEGEAGFRGREAQVLAELTAQDGAVLATGGGSVLLDENRKRLAARGTVVYLRASPEELYRRVHYDRNRPLLADRKSTRLNSSHQIISYAVFCLKKKNILSSPCSIKVR